MCASRLPAPSLQQTRRLGRRHVGNDDYHDVAVPRDSREPKAFSQVEPWHVGMNAARVDLSGLLNTTSSCDGGASGDYVVGVCCALVGSLVLATGMVSMRLAHLRIAARKSPPRFGYVTDPRWLLAFAVFAAGNGGDAVALTFAPQSVITPLGCSSLVSNIIVSRWLLKERVDARTALAVLIIIVGVVGIVVPSSADAPCSAESVDTIAGRWGRGAFVGWACAQLGTVLVLAAVVRRVERRLAHSAREQQLLRFGYVVLSGLIASWTVLFMKCLGELSKGMARSGGSPFADARTYLLVGPVVVSVPLQLLYLNKALQRFEAQFVVPALQVATHAVHSAAAPSSPSLPPGCRSSTLSRPNPDPNPAAGLLLSLVDLQGRALLRRVRFVPSMAGELALLEQPTRTSPSAPPHQQPLPIRPSPSPPREATPPDPLRASYVAGGGLRVRGARLAHWRRRARAPADAPRRRRRPGRRVARLRAEPEAEPAGGGRRRARGCARGAAGVAGGRRATRPDGAALAALPSVRAELEPGRGRRRGVAAVGCLGRSLHSQQPLRQESPRQRGQMTMVLSDVTCVYYSHVLS